MTSKHRNQKRQFMTWDKNAVFFKTTVVEVVEQTETTEETFQETNY